jgi:hypothetical protein
MMLLPFLRDRSEEKPLIWRGSTTGLREEELLDVVQSLPTQTRRRLHQLANWLGVDEVSAVVWLSERSSGPLRRGSNDA